MGDFLLRLRLLAIHHSKDVFFFIYQIFNQYENIIMNKHLIANIYPLCLSIYDTLMREYKQI